MPESVDGYTWNETSKDLAFSPSSIDSVMQQWPDSALVMLHDDWICTDVARNVSTRPYDFHYYQLLLAEALYKNDSAQRNRKELQSAMVYFDSLLHVEDSRVVSKRKHNSTDNLVFLDARVHYMNGVGYYENDSAVEACKEYMKTLEVMEDHFEEKELVGYKAKFMALTYTRLTMLFSDTYLHEQAIYFAKLSLPFYTLHNPSSWHEAWVMNEIGSHHEMLGQLDSADLYYQKAVVVLNNPYSPIQRDITTHQLYLAYKTGQITDSTIVELCQLLSRSDSEMEYYSRCAVIGEIFYREKKLDSAWSYLNKVFQYSPNIELRKQSAEWLIEICKTQGKDDGILEYANFLIPFANQEENQSEIKSQLTELYKTYSQNRLEYQHQQEKKKNQKLTFTIVGGLFIIILTIAFFLYKNQQRKRHLEAQIKEEQYAHNIQQKALSRRLKKSNDTLREALKRIEEQEINSNLMEPNNKSLASGQQRYEAFKQTPICKEVFDKVEQLHANKRKILKTDSNVADYQAFALSTAQLASLSKAVEEYFPELHTSLKKRHSAMNQKDWKFCLLYLLQLDKMSICVLLQETYHTCRRYTMNLEKVFGCQHGLDYFLIEQAYML